MCSVYETMAYHAFVMDEALRSYLGDTESNEFVTIFNFDGWVLRQGLQFTPRVALQIVDFVLKSVPIRPAAFHLVNAGSIIDFMMRIFKHLLPTKIQNRIFIDSNCAQLHEHLPPEILPKSLGGVLENEEAFRTELPDKIRSQEEFYQKLIEFSD
ncbi:alpha-tocopherol transfer protein [Folsomia candida]|nr:alpha-tocopherol transfer protein [Folsomia candida]